MEKYRIAAALMALVALKLLVLIAGAGDALAYYQEGEWSEPTSLTVEGTDPLLLADSAGDLHLFYVGHNQDDDPVLAATVYYMSRIGGQWRPPLDILFSPASQVELLGAAIDEAGELHIGWHDNEGAYHSRAHASVAGNANNWQTELVLPDRFPSGEMVLDDNGRLHMALVTGFSEVVYLYSDDGGKRWSAPLPVYKLFETDELALGKAQLAVDQSGALHVTWFETAEEVDWGLWSVWYGRSSDQGNSWQIREMASPLFGDSDITVDGDNNIHLVYGRNIGYSDGRWHQWSSDQGETWSNPRLLFPGVEHASGSTGGFDFALDSAGRLHMVTSYGRGDGDASAWHMVWLGTRWSEPELLLGVDYHAHFSRLAIAGGNQLEFVGLAPRQASSIVYRQARADSPSIEARPIPTRAAEMIALETEADELNSEEPTPVIPRIDLSDEALQSPSVQAPFNALLIGAGTTAMVILIVVVLLRKSSDSGR